jgi:hypothetical protein
MHQTITELTNLIAPDRRYREYPARDYIDYCARIRESSHCLPEAFDDKALLTFLQKTFAEEMEVLARICKHQFQGSYDGVTVQSIENDPPDGIITLANGEKIFVECTSSVDRRLENFILEYQRKTGTPISLTGFEGADIEGNRLAGYTLKGMDVDNPDMAEFLVEADEDVDIINRQRKQIAEKIEKKLEKSWQPRTNWLAIFVNQTLTIGGYIFMEPTLNELCSKYKVRLLEKNISALYFVGNGSGEDAWISFHPTDNS